MRFPGVISAMTTPFEAHGENDPDAIEQNVSRLLDAGMEGIVGTGTMGAGSLSATERRLVIETIVRAVGGRVPVVAGVSAGTPRAADRPRDRRGGRRGGRPDPAAPLGYGGNFYAIVDAASVGLEVAPEQAGQLIARGADVMAAVNVAPPPVHPEDERITGCRHVDFTAPGRDSADAWARPLSGSPGV